MPFFFPFFFWAERKSMWRGAERVRMLITLSWSQEFTDFHTRALPGDVLPGPKLLHVHCSVLQLFITVSIPLFFLFLELFSVHLPAFLQGVAELCIPGFTVALAAAWKAAKAPLERAPDSGCSPESCIYQYHGEKGKFCFPQEKGSIKHPENSHEKLIPCFWYQNTAFDEKLYSFQAVHFQ